MRGLGYGYYERRKVDWMSEPAWAILLKEHRNLEGVDLVRFSFELDEAVYGRHRVWLNPIAKLTRRNRRRPVISAAPAATNLYTPA
jgi:hypothetical protein